MEAGWTGKMSPTGAIGTGQFIQSTWDALALTPDGKAIGMTKIGDRFRKSNDPRYDKRINTLATALLARNNAKILAKNGIPLTGENLYMMHNIGPGIIPVMLGQPADAATLKAMQQNGMLVGQTSAQFLAYQKGRFAAQYEAANVGTTIAQANAPKLQKGVTVEQPQRIASTINMPSAGNAGSSTSGTKVDKDIVKGKGKTLVEA